MNELTTNTATSQKPMVMCIYHKNCLDGIASAWVCWRHYKNMGIDIELVAAAYGDGLPHGYEGKIVYVLDFSYSKELTTEMLKNAGNLVVLDHHTTAKKNLDGLFVVDESHSGAMLAWNHFNPGIVAPPGIKFVEDRDLWNFKLEDTKAWTTSGFSYEFTVENFDMLISTEVTKVIEQGQHLLRKHEQDIQRLLPSVHMMTILGYEVPVVNANVFFASDIAAIISKGFPFAAVYSDGDKKRMYSLRSQKKDGVDVSIVAEQFGGGGHVNAAGFGIAFTDKRFANSHKCLDYTFGQKLRRLFSW